MTTAALPMLINCRQTNACLDAELADTSEGRCLVLCGGLIYIMEHGEVFPSAMILVR